MTSTIGMSSAAALVAAHLPFDAIVEGLMREVGLTRAEATTAATAACHERDCAGARHARP